MNDDLENLLAAIPGGRTALIRLLELLVADTLATEVRRTERGLALTGRGSARAALIDRDCAASCSIEDLPELAAAVLRAWVELGCPNPRR